MFILLWNYFTFWPHDQLIINRIYYYMYVSQSLYIRVYSFIDCTYIWIITIVLTIKLIKKNELDMHKKCMKNCCCWNFQIVDFNLKEMIDYLLYFLLQDTLTLVQNNEFYFSSFTLIETISFFEKTTEHSLTKKISKIYFFIFFFVFRLAFSQPASQCKNEMKITFYEINEVEWEREKSRRMKKYVHLCVCVNVLIKKDHSVQIQMSMLFFSIGFKYNVPEEEMYSSL